MSKKRERSDVPYAVRLQAKKYAETKAQRDDAVMVALQVACVALNDTEGLGYVRLSRFAKRLQELMREFYADREVQEVHLAKRLEQMGFVVENGRMYCLEDLEGKIVKKPKEVTTDD